MTQPDLERAAAAVAELLRSFGLDPDSSEVLQKTPMRVASSFAELFSGIGVNATDQLAHGALLGSDEPDIILIRDLSFTSVCEHHLLPFSGRCSIAYAPDNHIAGIGRFFDAVASLASRPQVQERLGEQLAETVAEGLGAQGVLVVLEARHGCLSARGPRQEAATVVTVSSRGILNEPMAQAKALTLVQGIQPSST